MKKTNSLSELNRIDEDCRSSTPYHVPHTESRPTAMLWYLHCIGMENLSQKNIMSIQNWIRSCSPQTQPFSCTCIALGGEYSKTTEKIKKRLKKSHSVPAALAHSLAAIRPPYSSVVMQVHFICLALQTTKSSLVINKLWLMGDQRYLEPLCAWL